MREIFESEVCPFCAVPLVVASAVASVSERSLEPLKSLAAVRSCPLLAALAAFTSLSCFVSVTPRTFSPSRLLFFASLGHEWLHTRAVRKSSTTGESMEGLEKALRRELWRNQRGTPEQICSSSQVQGERQWRESRPQGQGWTKAPTRHDARMQNWRDEALWPSRQTKTVLLKWNTEPTTNHITDEVTDELAGKVGKALGARHSRKGTKSRWRAAIVEAAVRPAGDPDRPLVECLVRGHFWAQAEPLGNYASVEEHEKLVRAEVARLRESGFVTVYQTWADVIKRFGQVLVSKMAAVVKLRDDGTTKLRLIVHMSTSKYVYTSVSCCQGSWTWCEGLGDPVVQRRWRRGQQELGLGGRLPHDGSPSGGATTSDREGVRRHVCGEGDGPVRVRRFP